MTPLTRREAVESDLADVLALYEGIEDRPQRYETLGVDAEAVKRYLERHCA
ncbi:MAG: hypothetical protein RR784_05625 [Burkholderiaceae bacterium]